MDRPFGECPSPTTSVLAAQYVGTPEALVLFLWKSRIQTFRQLGGALSWTWWAPWHPHFKHGVEAVVWAALVKDLASEKQGRYL